jgi:hypothetical protein
MEATEEEELRGIGGSTVEEEEGGSGFRIARVFMLRFCFNPFLAFYPFLLSSLYMHRRATLYVYQSKHSQWIKLFHVYTISISLYF